MMSEELKPCPLCGGDADKAIDAELRDFVKMVADADSASNEAKAYMVHTFIYNAKRLLNQVKDK